MSGSPYFVTIEERAAMQVRLDQRKMELYRADFRAMRLLWRHLTKEQRKEYRRSWGRRQAFESYFPWFTVRGNVTKNQYRVCADTVIRARDNHRFCLVTKEEMPRADQMLMRKILIETDEPLFLATANDLSDQVAMRQRAIEIAQTHAAATLAVTRIRQW